MSYVNVPNDLSKIKTKMAFNLTKRQLVCFGSAAAVGIPSYLLARGSIGNTGAMFAMLVIMLPVFLLAMYEKDGLPFEKVVKNIIQPGGVRCAEKHGRKSPKDRHAHHKRICWPAGRSRTFWTTRIL